MATLKQVNRAIAAKGIALELVKGEGYFYFIGEHTEHLRQASVYVYRLNDQSVERWVEDAQGFADEIAAYFAEKSNA